MIGNFLQKNKNNLVGIDISSTAIKVVELSYQDARYRLESFYIQSLPSNAVVEQSIVLDEAVGEAVKVAIEESGSQAKQAAVAVSGNNVITKIVQMNAALKDDEMDLQVRTEADQYIPYPVDEVALDWQVLQATKNSPQHVDVLLAACRSENVERRVDALDYAGLEAVVVDVEAYCIERSYRLIRQQINQPSSATVAIIDIGSTVTTINIIHEGKIIYTRQQLFGGHQLTEEIMGRYNLSEVQASQMKIDSSNTSDYESEILLPFRQVVVQQVNRCLQLFFSSTQFNDIDHIVLAGGTSMITGLADAVMDMVGIETTIANPFIDMSLSPRINSKKLNRHAPALLVACGLALRGVTHDKY